MCIFFWERSLIDFITFSNLSIQKKLRTNSLGETLIRTFSWASPPSLIVIWIRRFQRPVAALPSISRSWEGSSLLGVHFWDLKVQKSDFIHSLEGYKEHMASLNQSAVDAGRFAWEMVFKLLGQEWIPVMWRWLEDLSNMSKLKILGWCDYPGLLLCWHMCTKDCKRPLRSQENQGNWFSPRTTRRNNVLWIS